MSKISIQYYKSPIGELLLGSYNEKLCLADYRYRKMRESVDNRIQKALKAEYVEEPSEVITETIKQMQEYFNLERKEFTVESDLTKIRCLSDLISGDPANITYTCLFSLFI